eukprot:8022557-Pyramimonas_sp.AAC.1
MTRATLTSLCRSADVVVLQECHGCKEDLLLLLSDLRVFKGWGTFLPDRAAGGAVILARSICWRSLCTSGMRSSLVGDAIVFI